MNLKSLLTIFFLFLATTLAVAQKDTLQVKTTSDTIVEPKKDYKEYNPLAPAKAAFFSAVLPGLGQAYNGKYWKIPIAYAGLGIGIYFYLDNDKQYDRYRNAYKRRLAGFEDDEFIVDGVTRVTTDGLIRAQKTLQRNKEVSLLVTAGIYILNIIDANVDAHLQQFNVREDLSFKPAVNFDEFSGKTRYGLSLNFNF
ncbi:hypothetical protein JM83_0048 [Gillisia sp. Hel_I_86]|uniref:DUF5683 domain-containing protein n=1 Tax=Gillisia sp. Hel_I_86 TaxID=1249981 RepID=UPI00119AE72F|nr:DUF5683 domain-containing protein [Gillisia sp. Hel_I_86]TVZ25147.1 hypothetical protein JM83_0048 [Gillisia sp. Hel_I_86]